MKKYLLLACFFLVPMNVHAEEADKEYQQLLTKSPFNKILFVGQGLLY